MIRKLLDYLGFSRNITKYPSQYSRILEIRKQKGKFILDSPNANYSYGSLYYAFDFAFQQIPFNDFQIKNILVLGMGAGCVVELFEKYLKNSYFTIDAVEIDETVIQVAKKYFNIDRWKNLNVIHSDAKHFVEECTKKYDFIIVDLFIDLNIPEFLYENQFLQKLQNLVQKSGLLLINTLPKVQDNTILVKELQKNGNLFILHRYKNMNEMLYWQKDK